MNLPEYHYILSMIRRSVSILLLIIVLFEAGGLGFGVQVRQWVHKISISVIMDAGTLPTKIVRMQMSIAEFDRIKVHEREFRLNDEMYDVVWRETAGPDYIIYCFRDAEEEKMIAKFLRFLSNSTSEEKSIAHRHGTPVVPGFVLSIPLTVDASIPLSLLTMAPWPTSPAAIEVESVIDTPPPRTVPV